jgi:flagellar hook-associated protein 3 FlgL
MDVGLSLGYKTGHSLSLRQERAELDTLTDSNTLAMLRVKSTTTSLNNMRTTADAFMDALIGLPDGTRNLSLLQYQAEANLGSMLSALNEDASGQYIFGGLNSKTQPINDYQNGPKAAVAGAFKTFFSFSQASAEVADITPDQMEAFLNGPFADLFGSQWQGTWSNASSQNIQSLISPTEKAETSVNANDPAFQKMAMAYTMVMDIGINGLNDKTRELLLNKVVETLSKSVAGVTEIQANLGTSQKKIEEANQRMSLQKGIFDERITSLEAVDPAEAKIRIDQIMTQIQTSYSLTAQLKQLSLINFL